MKTILMFLACACIAGMVGAQEMPREIVVKDVEFVLVTGGPFWFPLSIVDPKTGAILGSGQREIKASVDSFYIAKYEARARDFARFMNSGQARHAAQYGPGEPGRSGSDGATHGCSVRLDSAGSYYLKQPQDDLPATHLSWDLANELALWMGFRLPSDAEWVRAFRGDDKRIYPWGSDFPDDTYAAFQAGGTDCNVRPVTGYVKGKSPFGAHHMAGNTFEFVADWYNVAYMAQLRDGAHNPLATEPHMLPGQEKPNRMLRGGRWASGPGEMGIYGNRDRQPTDEPFLCFSTRFALDIDVARSLLADGTARVAR
jgi:formylglycine-generating enzyme required for sulfatase activity